MAWRVKLEDCRDLIDDDNDISMAPFLDTANILTTKLAARDTGSLLSAADLIQIEKYLTCHFYEHRDQLLESKKTGDASGKFQGEFGMGLESTKYGQTVLMLDETGWLKARSKGTRVSSIGWVGLPTDDQTNYYDRGNTQ